MSPLEALLNPEIAPTQNLVLAGALLLVVIYCVHRIVTAIKRNRRRIKRVILAYAATAGVSGGTLTNAFGIPEDIAQYIGLAQFFI